MNQELTNVINNINNFDYETAVNNRKSKYLAKMKDLFEIMEDLDKSKTYYYASETQLYDLFLFPEFDDNVVIDKETSLKFLQCSINSCNPKCQFLPLLSDSLKSVYQFIEQIDNQIIKEITLNKYRNKYHLAPLTDR